MKYSIKKALRQFLYSSAPGNGGYTMYWAIIIGIIVMSGYMVGGLIPKRFPNLTDRDPVQVKVKNYDDKFPSLQLRSFEIDRSSGGVSVPTPIPQLVCVSATIPGTSDPWLAGMPNGVRASDFDVAPAQSPVQVSMTVSPGDVVHFKNVTGIVYNSPLRPEWAVGPEGGSPEPTWNIIHHYSGTENGIPSVSSPINALIGVFLGAETPSTSTVPGALSFDSVDKRNYTSLSPYVKQPFFIGNGMTDGGVQQSIIVPEGATRLYLGTMDGMNWSDNGGSFSVQVCT